MISRGAAGGKGGIQVNTFFVFLCVFAKLMVVSLIFHLGYVWCGKISSKTL